MRSVLLVAASLAGCLASCHLADDRDPIECGPGTHPNNGVCAADRPSGPVITIAPGAAGSSCAVSPDSITVAPNGEFGFTNEDSVDHAITGADGAAWTTAKAGQASSFLGITKVGSWAYEVSGCAQGGTVVVQ